MFMSFYQSDMQLKINYNLHTYYIQNFKELQFINMIEESLSALILPTEEIISIIQQFFDCLNYPNTQAMLAYQKQLKNLPPNLVLQAQLVQTNKIEQNQENDPKQVKNHQQMIQQKKKNENEQTHKQEQKNIEIIDEPKNQQQNQENQKENSVENKSKQQFTWKHEQAKFYSKFATFSQILYCMETSTTQRQMADSKLNQAVVKSMSDEIIKDSQKQMPSLLRIFTAFDTISKVKKFTVPIYRNFSLQPKFSKSPKMLEASPKQHYALIVDQQSTIFLIHLKDKCLLQFLKAEEDQQVTALKWLNGGSIFAVGTSSGKINLMAVSRDKQMSKVTSLQLHLNEITSIYCNKDYLYTCGSDYVISKIYTRFWKVERQSKLKGNYLKKMTKIEHKKLKDIIFGIDRNGMQLLMIDEITALSTVIFNINKDHVEECHKLLQRRQQKIQSQDVIKNSWIQDVITNHDNNTLIIAVAGINPSIYEIDPLRNQIIVRLNHIKLKQPFFAFATEVSKKRHLSNIHMTLSHKSQILVVTTNSSSLFYVRIKNWRILHQYVQTIKSVKFGKVTATKRNAQNQQSMMDPMQPTYSQQAFDKQCIVCVQNNQNNNIQVYENFKADLKVIRSDIARTRAFLATGTVFPTSTQGFLQLLQTIRQNYQALV